MILCSLLVCFCILYVCLISSYILHSSLLHSFNANTISDFVREEIHSFEEMPLLLERFRRFVKLTTSPPKKKKTIALETLKHDKKEVMSIEDMRLNDKPNQ